MPRHPEQNDLYWFIWTGECCIFTQPDWDGTEPVLSSLLYWVPVFFRIQVPLWQTGDKSPVCAWAWLDSGVSGWHWRGHLFWMLQFSNLQVLFIRTWTPQGGREWKHLKNAQRHHFLASRNHSERVLNCWNFFSPGGIWVMKSCWRKKVLVFWRIGSCGFILPLQDIWEQFLNKADRTRQGSSHRMMEIWRRLSGLGRSPVSCSMGGKMVG